MNQTRIVRSGPKGDFRRAAAALRVATALCVATGATLAHAQEQAEAAPVALETPFVLAAAEPADPPLALAAAVSQAVAMSDAPDGNTDAPADPSQAGERSDLRLTFGDHVGAIRTEMIGAVAYMTAVNVAKIIGRGGVEGFSFQDEGLFGRDTRNLGMDKLVHAHNTYILSELIGARIRKKTGTTRGTAASGALLASGLMLYSEVYDGFKSGFGFYDVAFNSLGAGFSVLRNVTPGLEEKLDFRVLIIPNRQIYSPTGREHYRQLRHLFAVKLAGFDGLRPTPLRFVELHAGYYGKGFTDRERDRGDPIQRKLFVGVGVNLNQLLFNGAPKTRAARAASQLFDYWQPPYTYLHAD